MIAPIIQKQLLNKQTNKQKNYQNQIHELFQWNQVKKNLLAIETNRVEIEKQIESKNYCFGVTVFIWIVCK